MYCKVNKWREKHASSFVSFISGHKLGCCFFVHRPILHSMNTRWWHSRLLPYFVYDTKKEGFSSFPQQTVVMSKTEQVVVQKNYEQSLTACLFFWTLGFEHPERYTSIPVYRYTVYQNGIPTKYAAAYLWNVGKTEFVRYFLKIHYTFDLITSMKLQ